MEETKQIIIDTCLKIIKRNDGALIIYGDLNPSFYTPLVEQNIKPFKISENLKLFENLCLMDGAVIIDSSSYLVAYGVSIKSGNVFKDFGTRHAAGLSASFKKGITTFVVSEEDKKIRIFEKGKLIMQIDGLEKGIEKKSSEINNLLKSLGFGTLGTVSTAFLAPTVGITLISGVIIFGVPYYLINKFFHTNTRR